jgi:hypothetical protein
MPMRTPEPSEVTRPQDKHILHPPPKREEPVRDEAHTDYDNE